MRPPHEFAACCAVEAVHARRLDRWLGDAYPEMRPATVDEQWRGIDRVVTTEHGVVTLDYKCDRQARRRRRIFLETVSNSVTGRPGWLRTSEAVWLAYYVVPDEVWMFLFARLRPAIATWRRMFGEHAARNPRYSTLGVCVPFDAAGRLVEYIADLRQGDGAVLEPRDVVQRNLFEAS